MKRVRRLKAIFMSVLVLVLVLVCVGAQVHHCVIFKSSIQQIKPFKSVFASSLL